MADQLLTGTTLVEKESRSIGDSPIGSIVAWAKSLSGVPNLAEGWVECDGSVLVDALSPLNGQTIPDLNGGIFLEGRETSGATGGSATPTDHFHTIASNFGSASPAHSNVDGTSGTFVAQKRNQNLDSNTDTFYRTKTSDSASTENRPPFYTVVWIMRVR